MTILLEIQRKEGAGEWGTITTATFTDGKYTDTSALSPNTIYYYRSREVIDGVEGDWKATKIFCFTQLTESLDYLVKTTPTALTESLDYFVKTSTQITELLDYWVKVSNTLTESLDYEVKTQHQFTESLNYLVKTSIQLAESLDYGVRAPHQLTESIEYFVKTQYQNTLSLNYRVSGYSPYPLYIVLITQNRDTTLIILERDTYTSTQNRNCILEVQE